MLQSQGVKFLMGKSMQRFHKINFVAETQLCKHPIPVASMMQLWNAFYSLKLRSPEVVGNTAPLVGNDGDDDDEEEEAQRRHRRLQEVKNNGGGGDNTPEAKKNTDDKPEAEKNNDSGGDNAPESKTETTTENDPVRLSDTLLQKSMFEALVPAQPWKRLADKCMALQMEAAAAELSDRSPSWSRGRYIALHPRIEPEMMLACRTRKICTSLVSLTERSSPLLTLLQQTKHQQYLSCINRSAPLRPKTGSRPLWRKFLGGRDQFVAHF
mmetsp:Transcript_19700/g.45857  ORF Transcript_19700/g.45857 Transcript_19700/m.45857 type:complete len:268 (+) Transcript_19700:384-1187(+)